MSDFNYIKVPPLQIVQPYKLKWKAVKFVSKIFYSNS